MLGRVVQLIRNLSVFRRGEVDGLRAQIDRLTQQQGALDVQLHEQKVLLAGAQAFHRALTSIPHALILTQDAQGRILTINRHGVWLSGYDAAEIAGQPFTMLLQEASLLPDLGFRLQELQASGQQYNHRTELVRRDGERMAMQWHHAVYSFAGSNERHVLTVGIDVSDQTIAEDHMGWLSTHDPLTGLYNRRRFLEELGQTIATCERYHQGFAIMLIDLDQFKDINESSGHNTGDRMLQRAAEQLRIEARTSDIIARLGDDEFAVIVQMSSADNIERIAARFCTSLNSLETTGAANAVHRISASIGTALFPAHGNNADELLANADIALYQAKEKGRKTWHIFTPEEHTRVRVHERVYWDGKVRQALSENKLHMYFQPILDVREKAISHYEALLRVPDGGDKTLSAVRFIASAERSGLIHQVDEQVITRVLESLSELQRNGINAKLSINLSGKSFHNPNLVRHIKNTIAEQAVDPSRVIFEITETAAIADIESTSQIMRQIKSLGCQFALDDFGVGFSSLYYLKKLPVDYVKIDGSFIRNLHRDQDSQILVRALVEVSRAYRLQTVAEFVEDEETLSILQVLGVDYAQGYHIDHPKAFGNIWSVKDHATH